MSDIYKEIYAVPGADHIIDVINPKTGLTWVNGHTEAEVKAREPRAVRMTFDAWCEEKAARQHTSVTWVSSDEATYHEMRNVLPPAAMCGGAFLVGEPTDHSARDGAPMYAACRHRHTNNEYVYERASRALTVAEFHVERLK